MSCRFCIAALTCEPLSDSEHVAVDLHKRSMFALVFDVFELYA
jgi:hypothetical protein